MDGSQLTSIIEELPIAQRMIWSPKRAGEPALPAESRIHIYSYVNDWLFSATKNHGESHG